MSLAAITIKKRLKNGRCWCGGGGDYLISAVWWSTNRCFLCTKGAVWYISSCNGLQESVFALHEESWWSVGGLSAHRAPSWLINGLTPFEECNTFNLERSAGLQRIRLAWPLARSPVRILKETEPETELEIEPETNSLKWSSERWMFVYRGLADQQTAGQLKKEVNFRREKRVLLIKRTEICVNCSD